LRLAAVTAVAAVAAAAAVAVVVPAIVGTVVVTILAFGLVLVAGRHGLLQAGHERSLAPFHVEPARRKPHLEHLNGELGEILLLLLLLLFPRRLGALAAGRGRHVGGRRPASFSSGHLEDEGKSWQMGG
jgi:hypothetical protein